MACVLIDTGEEVLGIELLTMAQVDDQLNGRNLEEVLLIIAQFFALDLQARYAVSSDAAALAIRRQLALLESLSVIRLTTGEAP